MAQKDGHSYSIEDINAAVGSLLRFRSAASKTAIREVADALTPIPQGNKPGRDLALRAARHLLTTQQQKKGEKDAKIGVAEIYFHASRLDATHADTDADVLTDDELKDMYGHIIQNMRILSHDFIQKMAENQFFLPLLDTNAPQVLKNLFHAIFKLVSDFPVNQRDSALDADVMDIDDSQQQLVQNLATICVTILREPDDSNKPALDCVVEQLRTVNCADTSCEAAMFLIDVLRQSEDAVGMAFQTQVQNWIADNIDTQECALAKAGSIPMFLRNLTIVVPGSMVALTPKLTDKLASETGSEAVRTADFLKVQLSSASTPPAMRVDILSTLLDSVASRKEEAVRLRITCALPDIAGAADQLPAAAGGQKRVVSALLNRLLDPAPAVRVAAVRGLGDLCSKAVDDPSLRLDVNIESNMRTKMMQGIVGRLRDCVIDVREAAIKAVLPAFELYVSDASKLHTLADEPSLLDEPSAPVKAVVHILSQVLCALGMQDNDKIFVMAPDSAPALAFLAATGNRPFDAAVLLCLLTTSTSAPLVKKLLEWQNRLRMLLLDLFAARRETSKAQPADRPTIAARAQTVMKMIVAHYNRVMPKASLSFGTLELLFGQPDNKLFDALQSVCCTSTAEPIFPPVFDGRKRGPGGASSQTQSQRTPGAHNSGPGTTAAAPREEKLKELLDQLRQRLRTRAKEVQTLVRVAAVNYVTPESVLAFLDMLSTLPDSPLSDNRAAAIRVLNAVSVIQTAAPLLLRSMSQDLLHLVFHGTAPQAATALQLAAAAHKHMDTQPMAAADREAVASRLCKMAFTGPAAYAPSVMRAACALLPSSALPAFIQRLADSAEECLHRRSGGAEAVSAAHVLIQLMRDAPAHVAESATRLVEWVMDDLLQSDAIHKAGEQGCVEQLLDLSMDGGTWLDAPAGIHHTCALMGSLTKALIHGSAAASDGARKHMHAAVQQLVQRMVPLLATDADYERYGPVSDDDAALLRLTGALCLLLVGISADHLLPPYAYVELALVMHDGSADVRRVFGSKLRSELSKAVAALHPHDPPRVPTLAKYMSILCFAATEPVKAHRDSMLSALVTLCGAWHTRAADAAAAAAAAGVTGGESGAAADGERSERRQGALVHRPEYSVFFVIYLVAHHEDFPLNALLRDSDDGSAGVDDEEESGIRQFERMVGFHVAALLRAAPSAAQSLCLMQTCARIAARHIEDAEDDPAGSYTDSEKLVADLVLHTARGAAGKDAVEEAAQLHAPKTMTIQTRLFKRRPKGSGEDHLRLPKWYTFNALPREFQKLLQAGSEPEGRAAAAGGTAQRQSGRKSVTKKKTPAGRAAKAAKTTRPANVAAKSKTRPRQGTKATAGDQAGPAQQTLLQPTQMQALPDSESPAKKRPCRAGRQGRGEIRSLSPEAFAHPHTADASSPCAQGGRQHQHGRRAAAQASHASASSGEEPGGPHGSGAQAATGPPLADGVSHGGDGRCDSDGKRVDPGLGAGASGGPRVGGGGLVRSGSMESDGESDAVSPGQENVPACSGQVTDVNGKRRDVQRGLAATPPTLQRAS